MPLDPDPETNELIWKNALYYMYLGKKQKAWKLLEVGNGHGKRWLKLAKELNKKYPELTITQNSFGSYTSKYDDKFQLNMVNKIKNSSIYKITTNYVVPHYLTRGNTSFYKILDDDSAKVYETLIHNNPINKDKFLELHGDWTTYDLFGWNFDCITSVEIEKAPIIKPQGIIEFNVRSFKPDGIPIYPRDSRFKQMKHAHLFGSFKPLGTIKMNTNTNESFNDDLETFDNFSTWIDKNNIITEKTFSKGKKFTKEELLEIGLDEDDIDALEAGEFDEEVVTI